VGHAVADPLHDCRNARGLVVRGDDNEQAKANARGHAFTVTAPVAPDEGAVPDMSERGRPHPSPSAPGRLLG
jgi:hypothetical protein